VSITFIPIRPHIQFLLTVADFSKFENLCSIGSGEILTKIFWWVGFDQEMWYRAIGDAVTNLFYFLIA